MTFYDPFTAWYLAQLKPNCARIADRNLKRQGFKTFLPMEDMTLKRKGRFATERRPVFPGYIFVSLDISQGSWSTINSTHGVTRLVSFGKEPASIPPELMAQLQLRCDAEGKLLPPNLLQPGDQVKLTKGPFANFGAKIEKIAPDQRVWVLMDIMGGQTRVTVSADQLRQA